jgi:hypothetical protein
MAVVEEGDEADGGAQEALDREPVVVVQQVGKSWQVRQVV